MAPSTTSSNRILSRLSKADLGLLQPHLEPVDLPLRKVLAARNRRVEHVYFIESGVASVVANGDERTIEVGMIGREGMAGVARVGSARREHYHLMTTIAPRGAMRSYKSKRRLVRV